MAILRQPISRSNPFAQQIGDSLAPAGTFIATVLDIRDEFGVTRLKYQSTEMEKVDLTCFLFGFRDAQGNPHRVASKQMRISCHKMSTLFGFLKSMLGRAPALGWNYCDLKGSQCHLTIEHVKRKDGNGVFAAIAALLPLPPGGGPSAQQSVQSPASPPPPTEPAFVSAQVPVPPSVTPSVTNLEDAIAF